MNFLVYQNVRTKAANSYNIELTDFTNFIKEGWVKKDDANLFVFGVCDSQDNRQFISRNAFVVDIDECPGKGSTNLDICLNGYNYIRYKTASWSEENQKQRIIVPLNKEIPYDEWKVLNDKYLVYLSGMTGLTFDPASSRNLMYLPLKKEDVIVVDDEGYFNPDIYLSTTELPKTKTTTDNRVTSRDDMPNSNQENKWRGLFDKDHWVDSVSGNDLRFHICGTLVSLGYTRESILAWFEDMTGGKVSRDIKQQLDWAIKNPNKGVVQQWVKEFQNETATELGKNQYLSDVIDLNSLSGDVFIDSNAGTGKNTLFLSDKYKGGTVIIEPTNSITRGRSCWGESCFYTETEEQAIFNWDTCRRIVVNISHLDVLKHIDIDSTKDILAVDEPHLNNELLKVGNKAKALSNLISLKKKFKATVFISATPNLVPEGFDYRKYIKRLDTEWVVNTININSVKVNSRINFIVSKVKELVNKGEKVILFTDLHQAKFTSALNKNNIDFGTYNSSCTNDTVREIQNHNLMIDKVILCTKYLWNGVEIKGLEDKTINVIVDLNEGITAANVYQLANRPRDAKRVVVWAIEDGSKSNGRRDFRYSDGDYITLSRDVFRGLLSEDVKRVFGDIEFEGFIGDEKACDRLYKMFAVLNPAEFTTSDTLYKEWKMYYPWVVEGTKEYEEVEEEDIERDLTSIYDLLYNNLDNDSFFDTIPSIISSKYDVNFKDFEKVFDKTKYLRGRIDNIKEIFEFDADKNNIRKTLNRVINRLKLDDLRNGVTILASENRDKLNVKTQEHLIELDDSRIKAWEKTEDIVINKEVIEDKSIGEVFDICVTEVSDKVTVKLYTKQEASSKGGKTGDRKKKSEAGKKSSPKKKVTLILEDGTILKFNSKTEAMTYLGVSSATFSKAIKDGEYKKWDKKLQQYTETIKLTIN